MSKENREAALAALKIISDLGYAVVIWSPAELGSVSVDDVEDAMTTAGWDAIVHADKDANIAAQRLEDCYNNEELNYES